jgi:two-component system response regulator VicR
MKTILIIEDDSDILDLTSYLLIDAGYSVITSSTLRSVAYIKNLHPDLILLDHRLRDGLGAILCLEIKADEATRDIPVVFLSADINIEEIAHNSCADAYLTKPFDIYNLIEIIESFLKKNVF